MHSGRVLVLALPGVDANVEAYQKGLLEDLMAWKGPLPDKEAVEFIGAEIQRAGIGAKMASGTS